MIAKSNEDSPLNLSGGGMDREVSFSSLADFINSSADNTPEGQQGHMQTTLSPIAGNAYSGDMHLSMMSETLNHSSGAVHGEGEEATRSTTSPAP